MDSTQVKHMVNDLVDWYAEIKNGLLTLNVSSIPETDLNNLAGLILSQDDWASSEANGADNPEWEKSMLPALIKTMRTQKTGYSMEEFHDVWTSGVRSYVMPAIERMIEEELEYRNGDSGCHTRLVWDRATERTIEVDQRYRM